MGVEMLKGIAEVMQVAGGYGMAAIFVWLYLRERKENSDTTKALLADSKKSVEATVAHTLVLGSLKEVITKLADKE